MLPTGFLRTTQGSGARIDWCTPGVPPSRRLPRARLRQRVRRQRPGAAVRRRPRVTSSAGRWRWPARVGAPFVGRQRPCRNCTTSRRCCGATTSAGNALRLHTGSRQKPAPEGCRRLENSSGRLRLREPGNSLEWTPPILEAAAKKRTTRPNPPPNRTKGSASPTRPPRTRMSAMRVKVAEAPTDYSDGRFECGGPPFGYPIPRPGRLPKWPKGSDCKSDGSAYGGSNPSPATLRTRRPRGAASARRRSRWAAARAWLIVSQFGFGARSTAPGRGQDERGAWSDALGRVVAT